MKRNDVRPSLLVIDDNKNFLEMVERTLEKDFVVTALLSDLDYGQMRAVVQEACPDYVLLDVNLHRPTASRDILRDLTSDAVLPESCKIWLISHVETLAYGDGSGGSQYLVGQFQTINVRVRSKLLRKPINPRVLRAELLDEVVFEPPEILDALPLPTRVLHQGGTVVFHNWAWAKASAYEPDPMPDIDELRVGNIPSESVHNGCPFLPDRIAYTLHSFPLFQEGEEFLAQVVAPHPTMDMPECLEEVVSAVFEAMADVGFIRGRMYRIDILDKDVLEQKEDRVLVLTHVSDGHSEELRESLPLRRPLRGVLAERVDGYGPISREQLVSRLRKAEDDARVPDSDIEWWNQRIGVRTATLDDTEYPSLSSWLEVPVLADAIDDLSNPCTGGYREARERELVGLMVFDKLNWPGREGDTSDSVFDVGPEVDERVHVAPVSVLLNNLLLMMGATIQQTRREAILRYERRMRHMDRDLGDARDATGRYDAILRGMCEVVNARSAIMVTKESEDAALAVVCVHGNTVPEFVRAMRFPLDAKYHPIVAAWESDKMNACADFQNGTMKQRIKTGLLENDPPHWTSLADNQRKEFFDWLDQIGGVIAIPVTIAGRTIGGVTIQFDQPWVITRILVQRIQAVLHRARWVIQEVVREDERLHWHRLLRHDLSSATDNSLNSLLSLERAGKAPKGENTWWLTKRYLFAISDLAKNWSTIERLPSDELLEGKSFQPWPCFEDFVEMDQVRVRGYLPGTLPIEIRWNPEDRTAAIWTRRLVGNDESFRRIVRTLLDNAFKFGLNYLENQTASTVPITIAAEVINDKNSGSSVWRVCVCNPGHMNETEYANRFKAGFATRDSRPRGSHVGLSAARQVVEILGGSIEIENEPDHEHVTATLCWPLAQEDF